MLDIPNIEFYECQLLDSTVLYQSLDNEKQCSSLRDTDLYTSSGSCNRNDLFGIRARFIVTYFTDPFSATTAHTSLLHVRRINIS